MFRNEPHRTSIAHICLDLGIASRVPRPFLQRNINTILDANEKLLKQQGSDAGPHEAMIANERRPAGWDFPTTKMLEDGLKGQRPILKIGALQVRLLKANQGSKKWLKPRQEGGNDGPDWLPNAADDLQVPCAVKVEILDARVGPGNRRPVYSKSQQAKLIMRESEADERFVDVQLDKPFLIELKDIFTVLESGTTNGSNRWKRTITTKHVLEVTLQCKDSEDSADFLSRLESRDVNDYEGAPPNESILKAVWSNLPECPPSGHLLALKRAKGHKSLEMRYGVEVDIGWARRKESPLELSNDAQELHERRDRQLPTPSSTHAPDSVAPQAYVACYDYSKNDGLDTYRQVFQGLTCVLCQGKSPAFKNVDRLAFHYKTFHEWFDFELTDVKKGEDGKTYVSFAFTERTKLGAPPDPTDEYTHVASNKPFDISKAVSGEDSPWRSERLRAGKMPKARPPRLREQDSTVNPALAPVQVLTNNKRPALEAVQDLPDLKRKRYPVPTKHKFYSSLSKQPVSAGELLPESDDEPYDDRLLQSQQRAIKVIGDEIGMSVKAQEFHLAFNRHLDIEQSESTVLMREGIVRFTRKHLGDMVDRDWRREFEAKLKHLSKHGIINSEVLNYCFALVEAHPKVNGGLEQPVEIKDNQKMEVDGEREALAPLVNGESSSDRSKAPEETPDPANGANEESPANPASRCKKDYRGRFLKKGQAPPEPPSTPSSTSSTPKRKKPHKWSGTGADRDIINQAEALGLALGRRGSEAPSMESASPRFEDEQSTPGASTRRPSDLSRSKKRVRYQGGAWVEVPRTPRTEVRPGSRASMSSGGVKAADTGEPDVESTHTVKRPASATAEPVTNGFPAMKTFRDELKEWANRQPSKPTEDSKTPKPGICTCGKRAAGDRECIGCDNPGCVRETFHLTCVGLKHRTPGWMCADCRIS
jgi:hypothetical protein